MPRFPNLPGFSPRRFLFDTIMTAGPGGAENPLPGSLAALDNERLRKLNGNNLLTNASIIAPEKPKPVKRPNQDRLRLSVDQSGNTNERLAMDKRIRQSKTVEPEQRQKVDPLPLTAKTPGLPITVGRSSSHNPKSSDSFKQKHPTKNDLKEAKGLILEKRFPVDNQLMKREGRKIIVDEAVQIAKGAKDSFTQKDGVVFLGGHILSSEASVILTQALRVRTDKDFEKLINDPQFSKLNDRQQRAVLSIARSNLIDGPITDQTSRNEILDRLGSPLRMMDERVSTRKAAGGGGTDNSFRTSKTVADLAKNVAKKGAKSSLNILMLKGGSQEINQEKEDHLPKRVTLTPRAERELQSLGKMDLKRIAKKSPLPEFRARAEQLIQLKDLKFLNREK